MSDPNSPTADSFGSLSQINPVKAGVILAGVAIGGSLGAYYAPHDSGAFTVLINAFFGAVVAKFIWSMITN